MDTVSADHYAHSADATAASTGSITPGLILSATVAVSFIVCLAGFAARQIGVGLGAACVMLLASGLTLSWLTSESRRIRDAQRTSGPRLTL